MEQLPSQEEQQESKLARFLSSAVEDGPRCDYLSFRGDSKVSIHFGCFGFTFVHGIGAKAGYREFLEGVASSKIVFPERVRIELWGDDSCKHVEAFADALRLSGNKFRNLQLECRHGSAVRFAKCVSSVIFENNAIQHLHLLFQFSVLNNEMGREATAEFMAILAVPHNLRILKSFKMGGWKLDGEGMEQLMKLQAPPSALEGLEFYYLSSNAQLLQISFMLASSTSIKLLSLSNASTRVEKALTRGYNNIGVALGYNQSLESLFCEISTSMELKVLLDPLIPKNNDLQSNTTLIELQLWRSIGGKEGIKTIISLIHTNTSLLELGFNIVDDLSLLNTQGVENVLDILKALKTNKSLKRVGFIGCKAVGGYKVLGAMMDLLLENQYIEDIELWATGLEETGDMDYIFSALWKREKIKMWDIVQRMATVNPTSGRVFLCGEPFAGRPDVQRHVRTSQRQRPWPPGRHLTFANCSSSGWGDWRSGGRMGGRASEWVSGRASRRASGRADGRTRERTSKRMEKNPCH